MGKVYSKVSGCSSPSPCSVFRTTGVVLDSYRICIIEVCSLMRATSMHALRKNSFSSLFFSTRPFAFHDRILSDVGDSSLLNVTHCLLSRFERLCHHGDARLHFGYHSFHIRLKRAYHNRLHRLRFLSSGDFDHLERNLKFLNHWNWSSPGHGGVGHRKSSSTYQLSLHWCPG